MMKYVLSRKTPFSQVKRRFFFSLVRTSVSSIHYPNRPINGRNGNHLACRYDGLARFTADNRREIGQSLLLPDRKRNSISNGRSRRPAGGRMDGQASKQASKHARQGMNERVNNFDIQGKNVPGYTARVVHRNVESRTEGLMHFFGRRKGNAPTKQDLSQSVDS